MISLKNLVKKKETVPLNDHMLRIDCRGCEFDPDYGRGVCIRCISKTIAERGEPERIILRSGSETEYSGDAVNIMVQLSSIFAMSFDETKGGGRCSECKMSPDSLNDEMWDTFTITDIDRLIARLGNIYTENEDCELCIANTKRSFEKVREKLDIISKDALRSAYRIMGV